MIRGFIIGLIVISFTANGQDNFTQIVASLYAGNPGADSVYNALVQKQRIPYVAGDSVAFIYKGEANSVRWSGDFNGFEYDKTFNNKGIRIPGTDLWILKCAFPKQSRFDYKILIDERSLILDPVNPHQQWTGLGGGSPNSELRMPEWKRDPAAIANPNAIKGKLSKDVLINSKALGYQVTYSVYQHPSAANLKTTPILYVTDGYEYLHEEMGNMLTILDNLITEKKIKPIKVVFIDNREPTNRGNNRRMTELALNDKYLEFVTDELIPAVETSQKIEPANRAILGTSMGGLAAAYFAFSRPDIFGLAGIQSPSFWFRPEIYKVCDNPDNQPVKVILTTGVINDTAEGVAKMKSILEKNTCTFEYKEVPQGHSWGNWKDLIDDILIYFFAVK